jgi:hypothetical protein
LKVGLTRSKSIHFAALTLRWMATLDSRPLPRLLTVSRTGSLVMLRRLIPKCCSDSIVSETTTENHTQQTTSHYLVNDVASTIELKTTHLEPCSSIYDKPSPTYPTDDIPSQTELNTSHFDSFSSVYEKPSPNPWTNDRPLIDVPQYQPSMSQQ